MIISPKCPSPVTGNGGKQRAELPQNRDRASDNRQSTENLYGVEILK
jgi:hypothetical protein